MKTINGFALMEVMLSLFLFTICLLLIETAVVRSFYRGKHILLAQRAIYQALSAADYISKNELFGEDAYEVWRQNIDYQLPSGEGHIQHDDQIIVSWGQHQNCNQIRLGDSGCIPIQRKD